MKRKTVLVLLLAALVIVAIASFAACTDKDTTKAAPIDVEGKAFMVVEIKAELTDAGEKEFGKTSEEYSKELTEELTADHDDVGHGRTFIKFSDGKLYMGDAVMDYVQNADKIIVGGREYFTVIGERLCAVRSEHPVYGKIYGFWGVVEIDEEID